MATKQGTNIARRTQAFETAVEKGKEVTKPTVSIGEFQAHSEQARRLEELESRRLAEQLQLEEAIRLSLEMEKERKEKKST